MIIVAIQDGTTIPQADSDLRNQKLARITKYIENTQLRAERAEEYILDRAIAEARAERLRLDTYKQEVRECLLKSGNAAYVEKRMALYEEEFPEFLRDEWSPAAAAAAIIMGY